MNSEKPRILYIDDEADLLELRRVMLEKVGYDVAVALSGKAGVRLFSAQRFDVIVLDYWMADLDGLKVAEALKRIDGNVPIIMLSGYRPLLDEEIGRVERWIRKGESDPQALLNVIKELLSRK